MGRAVDPLGASTGPGTTYYHTDMLGTTRVMSDVSQSRIEDTAFTGFGEQVSGDPRRFGYAGAWGYQTDTTGDMPLLHVGARYYDPSTGRFLQRDPTGIAGGLSVYAYARNEPVLGTDPSGLDRWHGWDGPHRYNILGCDSMGYWRVDFSAAGWNGNLVQKIATIILGATVGTFGTVDITPVARPGWGPDSATSVVEDMKALDQAASGNWYYHPFLHNCINFSLWLDQAGLERPPVKPKPICVRGCHNDNHPW